MTTVYLIRHGTTEGNITGIFQGRADLPLNDMGHQQGALLQKRFADVHLDAIYTSPLTRARQTAEYVRGDRNMELILRDDLMELYGGVLDGKPQEENLRNYSDILEIMFTDVAKFQAPEGESTRQVYDRMTACVTEIVAANKDRTIAIVSHGLALMTYNNYIIGNSPDKMDRIMMGNMGVTTLHYEDPAKPLLQSMNDESHLPEELHFIHGGPQWYQEYNPDK